MDKRGLDMAWRVNEEVRMGGEGQEREREGKG